MESLNSKWGKKDYRKRHGEERKINIRRILCLARTTLLLSRIFLDDIHGAMGCGQKDFMLMWQCHQRMSGFIAMLRRWTCNDGVKAGSVHSSPGKISENLGLKTIWRLQQVISSNGAHYLQMTLVEFYSPVVEKERTKVRSICDLFDYNRCPWNHGYRQMFYASMAVSPVLVWVPSQWPLAPSVTLVTSV